MRLQSFFSNRQDGKKNIKQYRYFLNLLTIGLIIG
ncbi:hypothetical protein HBHAL_2293 [Halobacillus halophilus DSM 2266]|uniref:Uncharacterized protein n=1 Tax=Halobacillus halophilus (strain ATCC 35676 / DSM 2266 / JCM 20832 / KCTC 3685 / LMG 17431 / NBRC 102448 / NCIMB 2269) TaxID=866895 RepID=I0JKH3_HALH3|nr:hypothetical protein HBHAL_2293 [Halobacillus halophilus DSM 2266]